MAGGRLRWHERASTPRGSGGSWFASIPAGDGILAPTMHLHRECAIGAPEDTRSVSEVGWATPSAPRRGAVCGRYGGGDGPGTRTSSRPAKHRANRGQGLLSHYLLRAVRSNLHLRKPHEPTFPGPRGPSMDHACDQRHMRSGLGSALDFQQPEAQSSTLFQNHPQMPNRSQGNLYGSSKTKLTVTFRQSKF
ncbi:hypothetical protein N658DRAFT_332219 [Parathielavia hyrcaniae]|uniref:Uncharacterized protein n=1 Tax=Parathielavia hyrcaniae TaxID=113614 RepID=A0AAN6SXU5_9PEZI|nr:hypothetical protein N658DRAFT_332219 [Parathielavia hyrcaniae]